MTTRVPFKEGLFKEVEGRPVLIGCECTQCGQVFFPNRHACLNCMGEDLKPVNLGSKGKLYSFTTVFMPSEHFKPPYMVGWIQLPAGIRIFSQLRGWQECLLKIDMDVEMSIEKLWDDGDKEVIGYVFHPVRVM